MDADERIGYLIAVQIGIRDGWIIPPDEKLDEVSFRTKYKRVREPADELEFQKKAVESARKAMKGKTGRELANAKIRLGMSRSRLDKARASMGLSVDDPAA